VYDAAPSMIRTPPRRLLGALPALVAYVYALVVAPWLHAEHHARYGADHVHDEVGTHALLGDLDSSPPDASAAHADFHADLAALGLDDAATAGTLTVDCGVADYTLADCSAPEAIAHAARFGDALALHHHPRPIDPTQGPTHGQGSLEHLAKALLCPQPIVLPPPSAPHLATLLLLTDAQIDAITARTPHARGPPPRS